MAQLRKMICAQAVWPSMGLSLAYTIDSAVTCEVRKFLSFKLTVDYTLCQFSKVSGYKRGMG